MQDNMLRRVFILAGLAFLIWVLYLLKPVVIPFLIAFLIAYLFSPLVQWMHKHFHIPRWLSITAVFIGIGSGVSVAAWFLLPMIWEQLIYARDSIPAAIQWVNSTFLPWVSQTFNVVEMEINTDEFSTVAMEYLQTNYSVDSIQTLALRLAQSGLNFIQLGGTLVLVPIIAFYFLLDWERMLSHLRRLVPRPFETTTLQIVRECHEVLGAFVRGQFLVMVLLGTVYAVGLQLIGLEVGIIIGMVAGLASIIPYLGFAVGIIAAVIATFLQFGLDWWQLILVGVVFMIGQAIEGYVLQPFLLGDKIGLSPVAVVFAVLAGAQLFGFLGMLIALPVAAILVVLMKHMVHAYENSRFYKGNQLDVLPDQVVIVEQGDVIVQTDEILVTKDQQDTEKSIKIDTESQK